MVVATEPDVGSECRSHTGPVHELFSDIATATLRTITNIPLRCKQTNKRAYKLSQSSAAITAIFITPHSCDDTPHSYSTYHHHNHQSTFRHNHEPQITLALLLRYHNDNKIQQRRHHDPLPCRHLRHLLRMVPAAHVPSRLGRRST
jgi:hypothetical protein